MLALVCLHHFMQSAELVRRVEGTWSAKDLHRLEHVCAFANAHLRTVMRRSGENYAKHGYEVAVAVCEARKDPSLVLATVLHDLPLCEQGETLFTKSPLTEEEQQLSCKMHGLRRLHIDEKTKDLDAFLDAFRTDERLLLLRMAHRLNDVRHLQRFPIALRRAIARETLHMYGAIAGRMGMQAWRHELEDTCFPIVHPVMVRQLQQRFLFHKKLDDVCLTHAKHYVHERLLRQDIHCELQGRLKSHYSTYRKMVLKKRRFEELTDRLALRILVEEPMDCYRALAVVHACMHPIPGKLKDYIGAPKENGYQSIHTVVYPLPGVTEQPIEIQIRTRAMHELCEFGFAAHGEYKNALYALDQRPSRVVLLRNLEGLRGEARSPQQFEQALRKYFRDDHIAVFDGENNLLHLRSPATVLDFVCLAYPRRWKMLKSVRVNGRQQSFDYPLKDGDTVEVRFGRTVTAESSWTGLCRHAATRKLVRFGIP